MTTKNRKRGSVITEEVPEETYPDLLPFEMERVEAIMGTMFAHNRKKGEHEKKLLGDINTKLTSAKKNGENNWGHRWRESPVLEADDQPKTIAERVNALTSSETARDAITKKYWDSVFEDEDPILASVLKNKQAILADTGDLRHHQKRVDLGDLLKKEIDEDVAARQTDETISETD